MSVRIPITNTVSGGDYTAQILVGSNSVPANVILDTGSSTLAVTQKKYKAAQDADLNPTAWAQAITYGTGGWVGPVVMTNVSMGVADDNVTLHNTPLAIAAEQEPHNFGAADGILGLAYTPLNGGSNLHSYLVQRGINPAVTFPWPFPVRNTTAAVNQFVNFLKAMPAQSITPYFTLLEEQGITPNKFAFYTLRSFPSVAQEDPSQNPVNSGVFVLGGGEEQTDLYTGDFVNVDVLDDLYYNTNLKAVQVEGCPAINAKPLPQELAQQMGSNSVVDSGTNSLVLADDVFQAIMQSLKQLDPGFVQAAEASQQSDNGIPANQLDLARWPQIKFILAGENGEDIPLSCSPQTYWQTDFPAAGQAVFQIEPAGKLPQSILGLPLLNNYYTVFDRSIDLSGVIRFAPIKA